MYYNDNDIEMIAIEWFKNLNLDDNTSIDFCKALIEVSHYMNLKKDITTAGNQRGFLRKCCEQLNKKMEQEGYSNRVSLKDLILPEASPMAGNAEPTKLASFHLKCE